MTYDLIITHTWAVVAGVLIGIGYCKWRLRGRAE